MTLRPSAYSLRSLRLETHFNAEDAENTQRTAERRPIGSEPARRRRARCLEAAPDGAKRNRIIEITPQSANYSR